MRPFWWPTAQALIIISILALVGMVTFMLVFVPMPVTDTAGNMLNLLVGALISSLSTIVGFYFGSSKQSQEKDQTIKKLAENGSK